MAKETIGIDLMCGKEVRERNPQYATEFDGRIYFFCSPACKKEFDRGAANITERMANAGKPLNSTSDGSGEN